MSERKGKKNWDKYIYIQYTYKRQSKQLTTTKNSEKQTKYVPNFYLMKESSKFWDTKDTLELTQQIQQQNPRNSQNRNMSK